MHPNGQPLEPPDVTQFEEGRNQISADELLRYAGKFVAFTPDGRRILASGDDYEQVDRQLEKLGIHFSQVVHGYIERPDESLLG
jgi:hypothetical protein